MDKEPLGIVLHGYEKEEALFIRKGIEEIMNESVMMISASGDDRKTIGELLEEQPSSNFEEHDVKFLMFLGFGEEGFSSVMDNFPKREGLTRPIFCTLTPTNARWTVKELIDDLLEEESYWKNKRQEKRK